MAYKKKTAKELEAESKELQSKIEFMIDNLKEDANALANFMKFQSSLSLYQYSVRNRAALYQQMELRGEPGDDAMFASYTKWKELGYHVNAGERGFQILVPREIVFYKDEAGTMKKVDATTPPHIKQGIKDKTIESFSRLYFQVSSGVFNISQTNCPPEEYSQLISRGYADLENSIIYQAMERFANEILHSDIHKNIKNAMLRGSFQSTTREIRINEAMEDTQALSTLTHEIGHAVLHGSAMAILSEPDHKKTKTVSQKELEADCFSVMLQYRLGIDVTEARKKHLKNALSQYLEEQTTEDTKEKGKKSPSFVVLLNEVSKKLESYWEIIDKYVQEEQSKYLTVTKHIDELYAMTDLDKIHNNTAYQTEALKTIETMLQDEDYLSQVPSNPFDPEETQDEKQNRIRLQFEEGFRKSQQQTETRHADMYSQILILQLNESEEHRLKRFEKYENLSQVPSGNDYEIVYQERQTDYMKQKFANEEVTHEYLESLFTRFNFTQDNPKPHDYYGHSLSVSDIILVQTEKNEYRIYYCDSVGYEELSLDFITPSLQARIENVFTMKKEYDTLKKLSNSTLIHGLNPEDEVRFSSLQEEYPYLEETNLENKEPENPEINSDLDTPKEYIYYSTERPISIGSYPKENVKEIENYNELTAVEELGISAYGEIKYTLPLSPAEMAQYELRETEDQSIQVFKESIYSFCVEYLAIEEENNPNEYAEKYATSNEYDSYLQATIQGLMYGTAEALKNLENMKEHLQDFIEDKTVSDEEYKTMAGNLIAQARQWETEGYIPFIDTKEELKALFKAGKISKQIVTMFIKNPTILSALKTELQNHPYEKDTFIDAVAYIIDANTDKTLVTSEGTLTFEDSVPLTSEKPVKEPTEFYIYKAKWYPLDSRMYEGEKLYLVEHMAYGDTVPCLIVDDKGDIKLEDVWNGFDDYDEYLETLDEIGQEATVSMPVEPSLQDTWEQTLNLLLNGSSSIEEYKEVLLKDRQEGIVRHQEHLETIFNSDEVLRNHRQKLQGAYVPYLIPSVAEDQSQKYIITDARTGDEKGRFTNVSVMEAYIQQENEKELALFKELSSYSNIELLNFMKERLCGAVTMGTVENAFYAELARRNMVPSEPTEQFPLAESVLQALHETNHEFIYYITSPKEQATEGLSYIKSVTMYDKPRTDLSFDSTSVQPIVYGEIITTEPLTKNELFKPSTEYTPEYLLKETKGQQYATTQYCIHQIRHIPTMEHGNKLMEILCSDETGKVITSPNQAKNTIPSNLMRHPLYRDGMARYEENLSGENPYKESFDKIRRWMDAPISNTDNLFYEIQSKGKTYQRYNQKNAISLYLNLLKEDAGEVMDICYEPVTDQRFALNRSPMKKSNLITGVKVNFLPIRQSTMIEEETVSHAVEKIKTTIQETDKESVLQIRDITLPYVKIIWSEKGNPELKDGNIMSLSEAQALFTRLEWAEESNSEQRGYYKTKFSLVTELSDNHTNNYIGRFDIGADAPGLIEHISDFLEYEIKENIRQQYYSPEQAEEQAQASRLYVKDLWNAYDLQLATRYQEQAQKLLAEVSMEENPLSKEHSSTFYEINKLTHDAEICLENMDKRDAYFEKYGKTEKYTDVLSETVQTNIGEIPLEDYLDIKASQYGFDDYADMKEQGYYLEEDETTKKAVAEKNKIKESLAQNKNPQVKDRQRE